MPTLTPPATQTVCTCAVITDPRALESLRAEWLDLLARSRSNEPMLSPTWLLTWWRIYGPADGRQLRAVTFREGDRLVGLAPLLRRRHWYRPGIPFRRLELMGSGELREEGVGSDYLNVIAERESEVSVAQGLVAAFVRGMLGSWDEIVLPAMDGDGAMPGLLMDAFQHHGLLARKTVTAEAPYLPLPASWNDYLKSLASSKRYRIVRSLRDFEQWAAGTAQFHRATTPAELEEGRRLLIALHHERWAADGQAGVFRAPQHLAFHDAVMPQLQEEGALELVWLTVRGEPVAAQYNILGNGKVYYYQCGRKINVPANVRLGFVMQAQLIRGAIEAGRREFDLLGGVSTYKMQLATATRPLVQVRAVRPGLLLEPLRVLAASGIDLARRLRNTGRQITARFREKTKSKAAPRREEPKTTGDAD